MKYVKLTKAQWAEIKFKYIGGMSSAALGEEFGIPPQTIRKRCSVEEWPTADNLRKKAEALLHNADAIDKKQDAEVIIRNWHDRKEQHRVKMYEKANEILDNLDLENVKVKSLHDLEKLDQVLRRTVGLEENITKEENKTGVTNFNLFQSIQPAEAPPTHDV